jgi:sugar phosphate isomerase/epimerase
MEYPEHQFVISGFADEIASDLETQLDTLDAEAITHLDLRSVEDTNVLDLSDSQVDAIERRLDERDIGVSSIGSPIGKIDITDDFAPHRERFERALDLAERFDAPIRLFSYWMPEDDDPAEWREEVIRRMAIKTELAEERGVVLRHENEKDIYGDTPARCRDLLTTIDSPNLRAIFDPANFLEIGIESYPDALIDLVEYVDHLHVKDAEFGERGAIQPAGEGDGRFPDVVAALARRGYDGYASLEPHLAAGDETGGFSGVDGYRRGASALRDVFETAGVEYR